MTVIRSAITNAILSTIEENGGTLKQPLNDETVLLQSGLDSLGFAILVSRLEDELDFDPFSLVEDPFYPTTLGEFVRFYEQNQPR